MGFSTGYMGTKRHLAPHVVDVVSMCREGIVLDAFSGMCSVGEALSKKRNVWNNDVQKFAREVAESHFCSRILPPSVSFVADKLFEYYKENKDRLELKFESLLVQEGLLLQSGDHEKIHSFYANLKHVGNCENYAAERSQKSEKCIYPYSLFSITYAGGYFGIGQSIEIDSVRYALDVALKNAQIKLEEWRWLIIALGVVSLRVATTTGHFAQFIKPNPNNIRSYIKQRKKSVWDSWLCAVSELNPVGSASWRSKNKTFNADSLDLLRELDSYKQKPSVVYADPPYTDDQYSRYYHVWETLVLYDYPEVFNGGRYRPDRFCTPFSKSGTVIGAMDNLIKGVKNLGADLVISYPDNGLLTKKGVGILELLKRHYKKVDIAFELDYEHSTLGASKGMPSNSVKELIYMARLK